MKRIALYCLLPVCILLFSANLYSQCASSDLNANASGVSPTVCGGCDGTAAALATGGIPPYTYLWSTGETTQSIGASQGGTPLCINAGGNIFVASTGNTFTADQFSSGGTSFSNVIPIANTTDDELFHDERFVGNGGFFSYNIPVANGNYFVELYFAEIFFGTSATRPGGVGSRLFDVTIEGILVLDDYDIFADAGGAAIAIIKSFNTPVNDGTLNILFDGVVNNAKINALCVTPVTSAGLCAGDYAVTVTDNLGCTSVDTITLAGGACDDGDACTSDSCINSACAFTTLNCDDSDSCTIDFCDSGVCINTPIAGCSGNPCANIVCDDENLCTADACVNGNCEYTPSALTLSFDYENTCVGSDATVTNNSTGVDPAGTYYIDQGSDGSIDLTFPVSAFPVGSSQFIPVPGDVSFTVIGENPGGCTDTFTVSIRAVICDDADLCTTDSCANAICFFTPLNCDDGDSCTTDLCDNGVCVNTAISGCGGDPCTTLVCDDGDACTSDACTGGACVFTPLNCDDGDACTTDLCDNGVCTHTFTCCISNTDCDDNNLCTADVCSNGVCQYTASCCVVNIDCDDNNACTVDSCGGGFCINTPLNCDDGDSCTVDVCDNGVCVNTGSCCNSNSDCYDGDLCTTNECVNGVCVNQPRCDDNDPCTDDHCSTYSHGSWNYGCHGGHNGNNYNGQGQSSGHYGNHNLTCSHTPIDCRDGDRCTIDVCDNGQCLNTPKNCDDGDSCTTDYCDNGSCKHTQICCSSNSDCNDYDPCTIDSCAGGSCINTPMNCDDGDICTDDVCDRGWNYYHGNHHGNHDNDDDNYGNSSGQCKHRPVDCRDGNVCTINYCDNITGCVSDTIAGCCTNDSGCDDSDACTMDKCYNNSCRYFALGGNVSIEETGDFCQGNGVILKAESASGSTYLWSTGETTQTTRAAADSTYSVTVTNANGCQSTDTYTAGDAQSLLSSYVIIADEKVRMYKNTVFEGGVGATDNSGDIWLRNMTMVTAAGTFVHADEIHVSSSSAATVQISSPANVTLPAFQNNPYPGGTDANVPPGSTITLNGSVYDDITIGANSTVTFTQPDLYLDNLYAKDNVTLKFAPCTKIRIKDKLRLGKNNTFNPDENDVIAYVDDYVEIYPGSTVTSDIYVRDGNIYVRTSTASAPTIMKGLFIAESVEARDHTHWYTNPNCNDSCQGNLQPLIVMQKNDGTETGNTSLSADELSVGSETRLNVYPNPFAEVLNIEFALAQDSKVKLEIFNMSGQQIATVFEGYVNAGESRKVEFKQNSLADGMIIYRLQTESKIYFGKAVMAR